MRLKDADEFIKNECKYCDGACESLSCDCLECKADCRCDFIKDLVDAPTIEAKPVRYGKWIECRNSLKCSECGHFPLSRIILRGEKIWEVDVNEDLLYCPHCGSKMNTVVKWEKECTTT